MLMMSSVCDRGSNQALHFSAGTRRAAVAAARAMGPKKDLGKEWIWFTGVRQEHRYAQQLARGLGTRPHPSHNDPIEQAVAKATTRAPPDAETACPTSQQLSQAMLSTSRAATFNPARMLTMVAGRPVVVFSPEISRLRQDHMRESCENPGGKSRQGSCSSHACGFLRSWPAAFFTIRCS